MSENYGHKYGNSWNWQKKIYDNHIELLLSMQIILFCFVFLSRDFDGSGTMSRVMGKIEEEKD